MNRRGVSIAIFAMMMFLIPLLALTGKKVDVQFSQQGDASKVPAATQPSGFDPSSPPQEKERPEPTDTIQISGDDFRILDERTGKIFEVSAKDFVRGALAAEMPPTFHPEAMRAQAVAAHTYALCRRQQARESGEKSDFSADPENWKAYTTEKLFRQRYGDLADTYWKTICQAADEVVSYILTYEDEPIVAAYHSMSSGKTEAASNVWIGGKPYLIPVDSFGDTLAPDYRMTANYTADELSRTLKKAWPDIVLDGDASGWVGEPKRSESGYVTQIQIGNKTLSGSDVRTALGLRSSDFTISYDGGKFTFKVVGYGHGVGLSQYGADYMARQGASFDEILLHYYPGVTLSVATA